MKQSKGPASNIQFSLHCLTFNIFNVNGQFFLFWAHPIHVSNLFSFISKTALIPLLLFPNLGSCLFSAASLGLEDPSPQMTAEMYRVSIREKTVPANFFHNASTLSIKHGFYTRNTDVLIEKLKRTRRWGGWWVCREAVPSFGMLSVGSNPASLLSSQKCFEEQISKEEGGRRPDKSEGVGMLLWRKMRPLTSLHRMGTGRTRLLYWEHSPFYARRAFFILFLSAVSIQHEISFRYMA